MTHPQIVRPGELAAFSPTKMGKSTIFESPRLLIGLNCFEPGQEHRLHEHADMDKLYSVVQGEGLFLLQDSELPMREGDLLVAPAGVAHGIRNSSGERLVVLAVLAPSPR
jgi:quercetin dioxygenase-like cupin family protein